MPAASTNVASTAFTPGGSLPFSRNLPAKLIHTPGDGVHFLSLPSPHGHTWLDTPEAANCPHRVFRGRGVISLGPVLMYAELFIDNHTDLGSLSAAFKQAYPRQDPPIPVDRDHLVRNYIVHIAPLVPNERSTTIALWSDLTDHGLNRLAEVIVLAAQDRAFRKAINKPPTYTHRDIVRTLVRSLKPRAISARQTRQSSSPISTEATP